MDMNLIFLLILYNTKDYDLLNHIDMISEIVQESKK